MDTTELFITRKRKKWKFAHFDAWPHCFSQAEATKKDWAAFFNNTNPLTLEVGAGTADVSVELARRHPERNFIAVDVKADRLYTGAKTALEQQLPNIAFVRTDIHHLAEVVAAHSAQELWLTFPDPFARKKQAKHRLTHPQFLQIYRQVLTSKGALRLKTDNRELFLWSLEQLVANGWQISELSFDLHQSELPDHYKITTAYERRFLREGKKINLVTVS